MIELTDWPEGFMVVQGNRMEDLCETYVQWLKRYPLRPLEKDLVLTQSNGIAQWLKQTLAQDEVDGGCGIAAAMDAMLPGQFVWQSYCSVLPGLSRQTVYDKQALSWRLYRLLGDWDLSQLAPMLTAYVQPESLPMERLQLARQLADLYDQYQVFRPDWLAAWEQGRDVMLSHQGQASPLPTGQQWQPALWRALCADITAQPSIEGWSQSSRSALHQRFLQACSQLSQRPPDLPRRVVVFGMSSLPMASLDVLRAIAPFTQVLLFVMNPSQHYWGDMVEGRELLRKDYKRQGKRHDHSQFVDYNLHVYGNPLLASWGKQGRDFLHLFDEWDQPGQYQKYFAELPVGKVDLFRSPMATNDAKPNLLTTIQDDILQLRSAAERQQLGHPLDEADASVQFISAHSIQREIEILHDRLLDDFVQNQHANDGNQASLQPRDVLIMVPDIATYAPHIEAVFGRYRGTQHGPKDNRFLPYHIADTGQRFANPVLAALETLLALPQSRMTSVQGLGLLEVPACRQRFGIKESDLHQIKQWVEGANIRWALSEDHRIDQQLPSQGGQNTWQFGIDRLLLGFATGNTQSWNGIAAYPEVSGLGAGLLGSLSHFVARLEHWRQQLQTNQTAAQWVPALQGLWQDFFTNDDAEVEQLYARITDYLQQWQELVQQAQMQNEPLAVELVQSALLEKLESPSLSSRFMSGAINFATLMPMRAVPFKQIWLLGMDDEAYPRKRTYNDFDLISQDYRPGDRSRRDDDRYLFLEALLSAREKLVISWHGRSIKDDTSQPPSVLVAQLRDYLAKAWPGHGLLSILTTQYPLQPFSEAYFNAQSKLFTYANEWASMRANESAYNRLTSNAKPMPDLLPAWQPQRSVTRADLVSLLRSPVDSLYQQRLQIAKPLEAAEIPSVENFTLDGLQSWQLNNQIVAHLFSHQGLAIPFSASDVSHQLQEQFATWQRDGTLLAGAAGHLQAQPFLQSLAAMYASWVELQRATMGDIVPVTYAASHYVTRIQGEGSSSEMPLSLEIPLPHLAIDHHQQTARQVLVQASAAQGAPNKSGKAQIKWRNLADAWVQHLVAHLFSQIPVNTHLITPKGQMHFQPMSPEQADQYISELLSVWWLAMHEPLPLCLQLGMKLAADKEPADTAKDTAFTADLQYGNQYLARHYARWQAMDMARSKQLAKAIYAPWQNHVEAMS